MRRRKPDTVGVEQPAAKQTGAGLGFFSAVRLVVLLEERCNLLPKLRRHDGLMLSGIPCALMADFADVDSVVEQVIEGTPRIRCAATRTPGEASTNLALEEMGS